jgi:hypothetical protein
MNRIGVAELKGVVVDSDELAKGVAIVDANGLANLARYKNKLYAEAKGSGGDAYRVSLTFGDEGALDVAARCTCPAASSRDFCKHAAALLVAWARSPEAFAESDDSPGAARRRVRRGTASSQDLMKQGVEQVVALARDLAVTGVAAMGRDRVPVIEALGESLRTYKLRRLGARTLDLAKLLAEGVAQRSAMSTVAYAELYCDVFLTARKLQKHLSSGEPLDDRHVEELVGKTWQKTDKTPIGGLDLVEYAYLVKVTSDEFVIRESRLFDLVSGAHYSEKQIVPGFLTRRTDAKPSRAGAVRGGVRGSTYPGYPPTRLEISDLGDPRPIDHVALTRLLGAAIPDVSAALVALAEHRRDVFAPELFPVAVRVDALVARRGRLQALDANGHALHLPEDAALEAWLGDKLAGARLAALLGDVGVDAALPTLWPLAAIVERSAGYELVTVFGQTEGVRRVTLANGLMLGSPAWAEAARAAGASDVTIALAEVRQALADAFAVGLAALGSRVAEPLASRLVDLGLEKQAELLRALGARETEARLEDFVKLFQVLGMALVRLAGAAEVDRAALVQVPTFESVLVARPERWLHPAEIAAARAKGALDRYEAAVQTAHHYEQLPIEDLTTRIFPTWADGSASEYVARAFAGKPVEGVAAAKEALAGPYGRVAKMTAMRVLATVGGDQARHLLDELAAGEADAGLRALAGVALDALDRPTLGAEAIYGRRAAARARVAEATHELATATTKDLRLGAVRSLAEIGDPSAVPALRRAFLSDAAQDVRRDAALALALFVDTETVPTLIAELARWQDGEREAKVAAAALGKLGDVRGLDALLEARAEGFAPRVVSDALAALGPMGSEPRSRR